MLYFLLLLLLPFLSLHAEEITGEHEPLYAGTLLAFYPQNADPGRLSVEPYFSAIRRYGFYGKHWTPPQEAPSDQLSLLLFLETGITPSLDFTLVVNGSYSHFDPYHTWLYGDTLAYLGFQLLHDKKGTSSPDMRILIGETFPTGKYDHLNPHKNGSDSLGNGTYATTAAVILAKTFYWFPQHPLNFNLNLFYILSTPVEVTGFNCYGGTFDTQGKIKPGDQCITNIAIQCSFDRHWVIGADLHYVHQNRSSFSGKKGSLAHIPLPSSEQFSISPCIEYSWSQDFSVCFGPWFSVAGRNSLQFMSAVGTLFYYF